MLIAAWVRCSDIAALEMLPALTIETKVTSRLKSSRFIATPATIPERRSWTITNGHLMISVARNSLAACPRRPRPPGGPQPPHHCSRRLAGHAAQINAPLVSNRDAADTGQH